MLRSALTGTGALALVAAVGAASYSAGVNSASVTSVAGVQPEGEMDPMMQAMMEAGTPGEEHKRLASAAGEWKAKTKFMMQPGQFEEGVGTMWSKPILDGRYTMGTFKSEFMGMAFEGFALNGYDNVQQEYFSIWIDSMSTGVMHMRGKMEGDEIVMYGTVEMPQPMGKMEKKMVMTHPNDNTMHDVFYNKMNGEWVHEGEIIYTRVSGKHDGHDHGDHGHDHGG